MNLVNEEYETRMIGYEASCADGTGDPTACHHVGEFFSVVKENYENAAKIYSNNCLNRNYGPSCFNLGRLFVAGKGVPQSDEKAEEMFGKSCESKHLQGCYHQALFLYLGAKESKEANRPADQKKKVEALKLLDWACKEGEVGSCHFAGSHYLDFDNVEREPLKAVDYMMKACSANHAPACYNLAVMYKKGDIGIPPDEKRFEEYKDITNNLIEHYGGLKSTRVI
eukprot:gene22221-30462_t